MGLLKNGTIIDANAYLRSSIDNGLASAMTSQSKDATETNSPYEPAAIRSCVLCLSSFLRQFDSVAKPSSSSQLYEHFEFIERDQTMSVTRSCMF